MIGREVHEISPCCTRGSVRGTGTDIHAFEGLPHELQGEDTHGTDHIGSLRRTASGSGLEGRGAGPDRPLRKGPQDRDRRRGRVGLPRSGRREPAALRHAGHPRRRRRPRHARRSSARSPTPGRPRHRLRPRPGPRLHQQRRRLQRDGLRHQDAQDPRQGQGQRPPRHHLLRAGQPPRLHLQPRQQRHHGDRPGRDEGGRHPPAGRRPRAGRLR